MRADGRPETLSPDDQRAKGGSSDCRLHETQRTLITVTCAKEGGGEHDRRRIPPQCGSATIWNMPRRPQPAEKKAAEDRFFSECVKKSAREDHIPIDCSASVCDEDCNNDAAEDTT